MHFFSTMHSTFCTILYLAWDIGFSQKQIFKVSERMGELINILLNKLIHQGNR